MNRRTTPAAVAAHSGTFVLVDPDYLPDEVVPALLDLLGMDEAVIVGADGSTYEATVWDAPAGEAATLHVTIPAGGSVLVVMDPHGGRMRIRGGVA